MPEKRVPGLLDRQPVARTILLLLIRPCTRPVPRCTPVHVNARAARCVCAYAHHSKSRAMSLGKKKKRRMDSARHGDTSFVHTSRRRAARDDRMRREQAGGGGEGIELGKRSIAAGAWAFLSSASVFFGPISPVYTCACVCACVRDARLINRARAAAPLHTRGRQARRVLTQSPSASEARAELGRKLRERERDIHLFHRPLQKNSKVRRVERAGKRRGQIPTWKA